MSRRRFFVPEIRRGAAQLTGPDAEHLVRVLRVEPGQLYEISDNQDLYLAEIETRPQVPRLLPRPRETRAVRPPPSHSTLAAALFKFDRFEWLIEKATELGVATIQPFEATRTEPGLTHASAKRLARWEKVALAASQQSRRAHLPAHRAASSFRKSASSWTQTSGYCSTKIQMFRRFFNCCPRPALRPITSLYYWVRKEVGPTRSASGARRRMEAEFIR